MKTHLRSWTRDDFEITYFSGTGAGGQHRNKHQNCVRIKDIETGLMAVGQDHKHRQRNLEDALNRLADKLMEHHYPEESKERAPHTEVRRTYNHATNRITDHQSGDKSSVVDFDLDEQIRKSLTNPDE